MTRKGRAAAQTGALMGLLAVLSPLAPAASAAPAAEPWSLSLPGRSWALQLTAAGFESGGVSAPDARRASLSAKGGEGLERFALSAFVEPFSGVSDAEGCRDVFVARYRQMAAQRPDMKTTRPKFSKKGKQARSEYFIEEYSGQVLHQKHVNAYLFKDGTCIDVHVSALGYEPADAKVFERVLMSLRWGKPVPVRAAAEAAAAPESARGAPKNMRGWMAIMLRGAAAGQRGDSRTAIREYSAAREAALQDPKTTDMDMAQIDKALGGTYLEVNDAKNASIALRSSVRVLHDDTSVLFNLACAASMLGRMEDADRSLRACFAAARDQGRLERYRRQASTDPQLAAYRASPLYAALAAGP
jgi:hypothetical protein